jgi:uncharacterized lipoprotein
MRYTILAILIIAFLAGCSSPSSIPKEKRTKTFYDASKDEVVSAVVSVFTAEGYTIKNIDRKSGLVTTEPKSAGAIQEALAGGTNRQIQALVREGASGTKLTLTITWMMEQGYGQETPMATGEGAAEEMYKKWFKKIAKQTN